MTNWAATDQVPLPTHQPRLPMAEPFYYHPYGGIGRDVWVTREGFARFFCRTVEEVDAITPNMKITQVDRRFDSREHVEMLGYVLEFMNKPTRYLITIVDYRQPAFQRHMTRKNDGWLN